MPGMETKRLGGAVTETKVLTVNGVQVGEIAGYIAAWTVDRGYIPDRFVRGAFAESIAQHKARNNRQVRFKDHHGHTIGGYPIETVVEDERGLYGRAQVNLETQRGRETYSLARQGVLVDKSVGFIAKRYDMIDGVRVIYEAELLEGSIVDEPMNVDANIVEVKRMGELQVAPRETAWDKKAAEARVLAAPFSQVKGLSPYVGEHLVADLVDGKLMIVPSALVAAAEELKARGEAAPAGDVREVERLLAQAGLPSPFDEERRRYFGVDDVKNWTIRDLERALVRSGTFSNGAAKALVKKFSLPDHGIVDEAAQLLAEIRGMTRTLGG